MSSSTQLRRANSFEEVQRNGLFRCTRSSQLLSGFGIVFQDGLGGLLAAANCQARFPTIEQVQAAGASLYSASKEADHVDVFISHSWMAGRWSKFLALCLFLNLTMALRCAVATWLVTLGILLGSFGLTGLGGTSFAFPALVCLPMTIFFLVFIFGQKLCGAHWASFWLDRLCVHQSDMGLKQKQIAALPVFVANSSRMLILWDETYFERLWCNLELATFVHHGGMENVDLLPLWLAPWFLCSIVLDFISAALFELLEHIFPSWSTAWWTGIVEVVEAHLGRNPVMLKFVAWWVIWMTAGTVYLPVSFPSFFSFRSKLGNHQLLLDQMSAFDVRAAKCSFPADRDAIEEQVTALFGGAGTIAEMKRTSGVDDGEVRLQRFEGWDPFGRFNEHVRGSLRALVISQIGNELSVPWRFALLSFLPMMFYSAVNVLTCDNGPCEASAKSAGFTSVGQYMMTQIVAWILCIALAFPLTCPILLRMIKFALSGEGPLQLFAALMCCPLAWMYSYSCGGLLGSSLNCLVQNYSTIQLLIFLLIVAFMVLQSFWLFGSFPSQAQHHSCRCMKRQTYEANGSSTVPLFCAE